MDEIFSWTFIGQAESLEAELAREERIDAKIDKDIVALERMKTMQAMGLGRRSNVYAQEYESTKHLDSPEGSPDKVDNYQWCRLTVVFSAKRNARKRKLLVRQHVLEPGLKPRWL